LGTPFQYVNIGKKETPSQKEKVKGDWRRTEMRLMRRRLRQRNRPLASSQSWGNSENENKAERIIGKKQDLLLLPKIPRPASVSNKDVVTGREEGPKNGRKKKGGKRKFLYVLYRGEGVENRMPGA